MKRDRGGFSLIELLIVIGILLTVAVAATPLYGNLYVGGQVDEATTLVTQTIRQAQGRAMAGKEGAGHGVWWDVDPNGRDRMVLYQGDSYVSRVPEYDLEIEFESSLEVSTSFGGDDVHFDRSGGEPDDEGTVVLQHRSSGEERRVVVNRVGVVSEE